MKFAKKLALSMFASFFVVNFAFATPQKSPSQPKQDVALKNFNNSLSVRLTERGIMDNEQGEKVAFMRYVVENKSITAITYLHWIAVYTVNNEAIYSKDIEIRFTESPYFASKSQINVDVQLPLSQMPATTRALFESRDVPIASVTVAKAITYSNKKRIVIR